MIEINGVKYTQREEPKAPKTSKMFGMAMMMAAMYGGFTGGGREKEHPQVDIVKEFELIQNKKSNLSKADRDWVVRQFNRHFKPVE